MDPPRSVWLLLVLSILLICSRGAFGNGSTFVQLSDLHLDLLYQSGSDPYQDCHRGSGPAGKFGVRFRCDAPSALVNAVINFASAAGANSQFVVWTGDNARHDADASIPRTPSDIYQANKIVASTMAQVWPNIPIIPSIGNNDVYPHDTLCSGPNENLGNLSRIWSQWIPADQRPVFQSIGCYRVNVADNLVVVALNSMYLYHKNKCVATKCSEDGGASQVVMNWLTNELKSAQSQGKRVIISGHVPPDPDFWHKSCLHSYFKLAAKYQNTIAGHLFGHTHQDNFLMIHDPNTNVPVGVVNIAPSGLSTFNPSVRLFKYDSSSAAITDYIQYYSNLTADNLSGSAIFQEEYSWLKAYGYPVWTANNWAELASSLIDNPAVYAKYLNYRYLSSGYTQFACSEADLLKGTCILHLDKFHLHQ